jgi:hypothetical protein
MQKDFVQHVLYSYGIGFSARPFSRSSATSPSTVDFVKAFETGR